MLGSRFLVCAFTAGALLVSAVCARADSLRADFSPLTLRPRTNSPAIYDIRLHRQGAGLLEGVLEITFEAGGDVILRQRTQDLTLAAGTQSFRIIVPPLPPQNSYTGTEARLRFVTKTAVVELGRFPVAMASLGTRSFVMALGTGPGSGARDLVLWQSLRLESFFAAGINGDRLLATSPAFLDPEDFPTNPLALFAFDLVMLDGDGFALLREKQLAALTRWVEAGGSLCVLPGRGLKDEHVRFLNAFPSPKQAAPFEITDTGELVSGAGEPQLLRSGLGRVVIAIRPAEEALAQYAWLRAAAHLWNIRVERADLHVPVSQRQIATQKRNANTKQSNFKPTSGDDRAARRQNVERLLSTLLPQSTRLLSPSTLALILAGFLIVVGPLDWFTLGILRRRRWTWFVFPLASAGFTALVIYEAGRALGREDNRATLTITDMGASGRVLRESRFELLLAARDRDVTTEVVHGFAAPTGLGMLNRGSRSPGGDAGVTAFRGQIPARYTLRQQIRQWTPQFNRITSLEASSNAAAAIPWAEIENAIAGGGRTPDIPLRAVATRNSGLGVFLFHRDSVVLSANPSAPLPTGLTELCRGPKFEFGKFLARSAPNAAGDFEDLPLLDPSDPHEWLLVISQRTAGGLQLHRRLFRTDD